MNVSLVNALANAMLRDYREVETSADHALNRSDAACVIDCVLSLNRDYDRFVLPRVMRFVQEHPGVTSVAELQFMMRACASPHEFVQLHLGYNHAKRAEILMAVVDYLTTVGDLREWARSADPGDTGRFALTVSESLDGNTFACCLGRTPSSPTSTSSGMSNG
ncbi:MAG: hypothetical protein HZT41_11745 [Dechloromonas sp.]|nr:MAG: hypothetical protein HZT41_11745 [Dechloromonas sp.]